LLASGRFLTVFPESMVRLGLKHVPYKVLPVAIPNPPRPVMIIGIKNRMLSPAARLFIETAREAAKSFPKRKS
jgi:DNA-binding transcriptional LysR family regulator